MIYSRYSDKCIFCRRMRLALHIVGLWFSGCKERTAEMEPPPRLDRSRQYKSPPVPVGQVVADPAIVKEFFNRVDPCEEIRQEDVVDRCETSWREIKLENGEILRLGKMIASGDFGKVFAVNGNDDYIVKFAHAKPEAVKDLCKERLVLELLNGLSGAIPRAHKVESNSIVGGCHSQIIVMDKVGELDWKDSVQLIPDAWFYRRLARLIEVVMSLHDVGFLHADIKGNNIRVNRQNPEKLFLIDFGISLPFIDKESKHSLVFSRTMDMKHISKDLLHVYRIPKNSWYDEFQKEIESLAISERPPYEKWIRCFRLLSLPKFRGFRHCPT